MTPLVQLLVSEWCEPCRGAESLWRDIARHKAIDFQVLDVAQPDGRTIIARLGIRTVPATVINGHLEFVGIPERRRALAAVAGAEDRVPDDVEQVGITLLPTSAWSIVAAAAYLGLLGAVIAWSGGSNWQGPMRIAMLHGFGLGFAALSVFGFAEHMIPRFMSAPIRIGWLAWFQQGLVHLGVLLTVAGALFESRTGVLVGGVAAWLSFAIFTTRLAPVLMHKAPSI